MQAFGLARSTITYAFQQPRKRIFIGGLDSPNTGMARNFSWSAHGHHPRHFSCLQTLVITALVHTGGAIGSVVHGHYAIGAGISSGKDSMRSLLRHRHGVHTGQRSGSSSIATTRRWSMYGARAPLRTRPSWTLSEPCST